MHADRVLAQDAATHPLQPDAHAGAEIVAGTPRAASAELDRLGEVEIGLWELSGGTVRDIEAEEVFVVLGGSGTLRFDDGQTVDLRPGTVVRLHEGDRTEWTVSDTLRKLYLTP